MNFKSYLIVFFQEAFAKQKRAERDQRVSKGLTGVFFDAKIDVAKTKKELNGFKSSKKAKECMKLTIFSNINVNFLGEPF